ncbi:MAG: hypothetical protein KF861_01145 [Planctomycetaceae bacterium]|nr:hypothetical protein [Planctomycetaceae bacterium]
MQNWFAKKDGELSENALEGELVQPTAAALEEDERGAFESSAEPRELLLLTEAHRAIAEVHGLDGIKAIRDKAEAVRKYAQSAGMGLDLQNYAAEVKLRAERKAGELLSQLQLHGGDRKSEKADARTKLEDLGITKDQSSRWQLTAAIPSRDFEKYVTETKSERGEVTTAGLLRVAKEFVAQRKKRFKQRHRQAPPVVRSESPDLTESLKLLIEGQQRFACIYVNPAWPFGGSEGDELSSLFDLPVSQVCKENAHLHLWVAEQHFSDAPRLIDSWGFKFASCFVWVSGRGGSGEYWKTSHRLLALGVRGALPFRSKTVLSWIRADSTNHTAKPELVRRLIERVSPGPYLELFGTNPVPGWTVLGHDSAQSDSQ